MIEISEIIKSVSNGLINDQFVKSGSFIKNRNNRGREILERYVGGFSVVFPFITKGKKWAFRCWHANVGNMQKHYEVLARELAPLKLPYFCNFSYSSDGVLVNGFVYPTTTMEWIDGVNLKEYLCQHANDRQRIERLAESFLQMIKALHEERISHGDLQHGNILVNDKGELFLIDYDSVCTPSLIGQPNAIVGLVDYQHPSRFTTQILSSEKNDYFSELIIYISILAIAQESTLVEKYSIKESERLLFSKDDFEDVESSQIYKELSTFGDKFGLLLKILKEYLNCNRIEELEAFDVLLEKYSLPVRLSNFVCQQGKTFVEGECAEFTWDGENVNELYFDNHKIDETSNCRCIPMDTLGKRIFTIKGVNGLNSCSVSVEVNVVSQPEIKCSAEKEKLRKGKEKEDTIRWEITEAVSASLIIGDETISIPLKGEMKVSVEGTTIYRIEAKALNNRTVVKKDLTINVFNESEIDFSIDKEYTFSGIPITLSWNVKHALRTMLNGEEVCANDFQTTTIDKETSFTLTAIDEFGESKKTITVRILPLPIIKSILIPAPSIEHTISLAQLESIPNVGVEINSQVGGFAELDACTMIGGTTQMSTSPQYVSIDNMVKLEYNIKKKGNKFINKIKRLWKR